MGPSTPSINSILVGFFCRLNIFIHFLELIQFVLLVLKKFSMKKKKTHPAIVNRTSSLAIFEEEEKKTTRPHSVGVSATIPISLRMCFIHGVGFAH